MEAGRGKRSTVSADPSQARLAELLSRTALGDRKAFAELYEATRSKLFAVSLRIVRERSIAEEALQDGFVSVWNHAGDYSRARSAPLTWMTSIVRNRCLDIVRRTRELPDVDDTLAGLLVDESAAPMREAQARAEAHSLRRCLDELEPEQRQSIALAFFHGLTHSELAAHMRKPLGTVKTHVRRGLARLRECLSRDGLERG
jgi:RNA polymerase sigma-70 factor (ECF subfamily)